jgi:RND family efflux transporter MFP subunit
MPPAVYAAEDIAMTRAMTRTRLVGALIAVVALALFAWRWFGRSPASADDPDDPADGGAAAVLPAAVVRVQRHNVGSTLTIAGEFKAFQDVDVHAKVAGYIRKIYVDVGDHVKAGQTLAVLEAPELAAQLTGADAAVRAAQEQIGRAQGDVQRTQSAHAAAHSAYTRLKQASDARSGLVAQQEVDDAQAKDLGSEGQVASAEAELSAAKQQMEVAQANQEQYAALSGYMQITAPFAGVITNRFADTGALVAAGTSSSTQAIAVVHLAQVSVLRLVLPIPESVAAQIHLGDAVNVRVQALDRDIHGKVSRFADSLDLQTRTMVTEIDVENRDGRLMPGMYTETKLSLREKKNALTIPLETVTRNGDDATVLALSPQNKIDERHIQLGVEDNERVEVASGLNESDRVVIGNRSQFRAGQIVQPKDVGAPVAKTGGEN